MIRFAFTHLVPFQPMSFRVYLWFGSLLLLASCSKQSVITYRMKNIASDSIDVIRTRIDGSNRIDTIQIGYNQQVTIAVSTEGGDHVSKYRESGEKLRRFTRIDVYRNHTLISRTNFLLSSRWAYRELGRHAADYEAVVTDADF